MEGRVVEEKWGRSGPAQAFDRKYRNDFEEGWQPFLYMGNAHFPAWSQFQTVNREGSNRTRKKKSLWAAGDLPKLLLLDLGVMTPK
jgi:hypothetical protein